MSSLNTAALLEVDHLSKIFPGGVTAIKDVSFAVDVGQFVCVLGPSGCGKTTLLRLVAGLDTPTAGNIRFQAKKIEGPGRERGMVFQRYTSFPWLTVEQNIAFGLEGPRSLGRPRSEIVDELVVQMDLGEFRHAYPAALSGGMQQRLALARTLAVQPRILLLDEPFGALDSQTRADMQLLLLSLYCKSQPTILFVTHDIEEAIFLGQRLVISGPRPFEIMHDMQIPFTYPREEALKLSTEFVALEEQVTLKLRKLAHKTSAH